MTRNLMYPYRKMWTGYYAVNLIVLLLQNFSNMQFFFVYIVIMYENNANFSEILIEIHLFSFKKMHLKMSSAK